jgi:hypothetical protein
MKIEYTEKYVTEIWDKVSYWQDLSDELATLVEKHFGQNFGDYSSHSCRVLNAIEYLKSKP